MLGILASKLKIDLLLDTGLIKLKNIGNYHISPALIKNYVPTMFSVLDKI